jgi:hypothetical protein
MPDRVQEVGKARTSFGPECQKLWQKIPARPAPSLRVRRTGAPRSQASSQAILGQHEREQKARSSRPALIHGRVV